MTRKIILAVLVGAALGGCQDLDVTNLNAPDRDRALTSAGDVETLVVSSWLENWNTSIGNTDDAYNTISLVADEMSGTYANNAALELSSDPRVAFNNSSTSAATIIARTSWEGFYEGISSVNDGLTAIDEGLQIIIDEDDVTSRLWAFGKWNSAFAHGWLSMLHDRVFILHHSYDVETEGDLIPLVDHQAAQDSAIAYMLEAIDSLEAESFTFPQSWIPNQTRTSEDLIRLGHSSIAQWLVYGARTPEDRANLDWNRVLSHLDQGITEDFIVDMSTGEYSVFHNPMGRMQSGGTFAAWGDYKLIGPADVSGAYAAWLATPIAERQRFDIVTTDRRITGTNPTEETCKAIDDDDRDPQQCNGSIFRYETRNIFSPERGTYHQSHYRWYRNREIGTYSTSNAPFPWFRIDEMNLLRAEAYYHLGRFQDAADLINITRLRPVTPSLGDVQVPQELEPVTVDGVTGPGCVPRLDGVNCADLHGALMYERMIELSVHNAYRAWIDSRGWGRLQEGTFLHIPIPGRELEALGIPLYSFGGLGGEGSAVCLPPYCQE
jgi:hypothetical protein